MRYRRRTCSPGRTRSGAAAPWFPPRTIHVAVVDPGVGTRRRALLVETSDAWLVGPDNGVLSLAASGARGSTHLRRVAFARAAPTGEPDLPRSRRLRAGRGRARRRRRPGDPGTRPYVRSCACDRPQSVAAARGSSARSSGSTASAISRPTSAAPSSDLQASEAGGFPLRSEAS